MPYSLDWKYAWQGLDATVPAPMVSRLEKELPVLPFLSLPFAEELVLQLEELGPRLKRFKHMLLLGIGGSALGPRALQKAFFPGQDQPCHQGPWLWIADNVAPDSFAAHLEKLPPSETVVLTVSKSGGTIETVAQYFLACQWLQKALPQQWREHMLLVTDAKQGFLREEARKYDIFALPVPDNLGGRYSVLSAVGLLPAAFMGMDWKGLLQGAMDEGRPLAGNTAGLGDHAAWKLASWAVRAMQHNFSQLIFFCYAPSWATFGPWFAQLWAESLGKEGQGSMPLPATGVTDQHSLLQMFLDGRRDKACLFVTAPEQGRNPALPGALPEPWGWLAGTDLKSILDAETLATRMSLASHSLPLLHLDMADNSAYSAGRMIMLLEAATVFAGWQMGINPIDQPAVEEGKRLAYARLGAPGREAEVTRLQAFLSE